jgi:hypothetical protein
MQCSLDVFSSATSSALKLASLVIYLFYTWLDQIKFWSILSSCIYVFFWLTFWPLLAWSEKVSIGVHGVWFLLLWIQIRRQVLELGTQFLGRTIMFSFQPYDSKLKEMRTANYWSQILSSRKLLYNFGRYACRISTYDSFKFHIFSRQLKLVVVIAITTGF